MNIYRLQTGTMIEMTNRISITSFEPLFSERNKLGFWQGAKIYNLLGGYRIRISAKAGSIVKGD